MTGDATPILLLNDDPFVLRLMGHQLTRLGFIRVLAMDQAAEALADGVEDGEGSDLLRTMDCDLAQG